MMRYRKGDNERSSLFTRRALLLGGAQAALMSALVGRLYQLQVLETNRFATLAEENRVSMRLLPPPRGLIFDRTGQPLAINRNNFRAMATSDRGRGAEILVDRLDQILNLGEADKQRLLRELRRSRNAQPVVVRENLGWEEVARLEFNAPDLPGMFIDLGQTRDYPEGALMSHIIGYTGRASDEDLNGRDDPLLSLPTMRFGKKGMERALEDDLRGRAGAVQVEVNAVGRVVRELDRTEGQPGVNALLTIDLDLQRLAADRLAEHHSGSVVVIDVITGDVIVMASTPGFDPNMFARGITQSEWRDLLDNPERPLNNKAIQGVYPPGSTYKICTALAALESKAIDPGTVLPCPGYLTLGDIKFHCWLAGGHGGLNVQGAITNSCDCFFYEAARRAGVDRIDEVAAKLGFGKVSELGLPGESAGNQPSRAWKQDKYNVPWQQGDTLQPRHRPGLHDGDAVAARDHDRARRQRRLRGAAEPPARQGDAARGAGAAADAREARRAIAALEPAVRGHRAPGHDRRGECRRRHGQPAADRRQGQADRAAVPLCRQDRHGAGQAHHRARARAWASPRPRCPGTCAITRCSSASGRSTIRAMPARSSSSTAWRAARPPARSAATCCSRP